MSELRIVDVGSECMLKALLMMFRCDVVRVMERMIHTTAAVGAIAQSSEVIISQWTASSVYYILEYYVCCVCKFPYGTEIMAWPVPVRWRKHQKNSSYGYGACACMDRLLPRPGGMLWWGTERTSEGLEC